jgi:hypothetical protein
VTFENLNANPATNEATVGGELYADLAPLVDVWGDPVRSPAGHFSLAKSFGPYLLLRFDESSGITAADVMGNDPGVYNAVTLGQPSLYSDNHTAALFSGAANSEVMTTVPQGPSGINTLALEIKFQTTTAQGGGLIQFGNNNVIGANPTNYDRHLWMSNDGKLHFGFFSAGFYVVDSPLAYNDGNPHEVFGMLVNGNLYLYVDGLLIASNTTGNGRTPDVHSSADYWRIGRAYLSSWANAPTNQSFTGIIDEPAVYYATLTDDQIAKLAANTGNQGDLEIYCRALGAMIQPVDDIAKDGPNGEPGWSQVLDINRAEDAWLMWLGQWAGYIVPAQAATETEAAWSARERGKIVHAAAHHRATVAHLVEAIQDHLNDPKQVIIQERVGDAHTINVYVFNSQIATSAARVEAAARAQKAAGLIMNFTVLTGANYTLLQASNTSYTIMSGKHANYNSVLTNPGL